MGFSGLSTAEAEAQTNAKHRKCSGGKLNSYPVQHNVYQQ